MSKKSPKIAALIEAHRGRELDAHYLGFFDCFNRELFYESHDILEELWLRDKASSNYCFHKGLIQLAGAFVHLQKDRLKPSAALFKLARANLEKYSSPHECLDIRHVLELIEEWLARLENGDFEVNPFNLHPRPKLLLNSNRIAGESTEEAARRSN